VRDEHILRAFQNDADKKFWTEEGGGSNVRMNATAKGRAFSSVVRQMPGYN
jgi:hypothetical protein